MYGLVNQGIKDLVLSLSNQETWTQICLDANAPDEYISMQYYEDETTYRLVAAVSKKLNLQPEKILGEFGKYWILYTAKEGYGPIMDLFGEDFKSCLKNLNHLHSRMGMTMPKLSPPSFIFTELSDTKFQLEYKSKRSGLSPMVQGLLEGLAIKYNTKVEINYSEINERKIFTLEIVGK
tara:strand:+ start:63231 stop:63767 length:537 start_codon:yes stop_codon:yes gene_type:complete